MIKNIRIIIMLSLFSFIANKASADANISEFSIDSQYLNSGKLRLNAGQETPFTAKFTIIKGSAIDNIDITTEVGLFEGGKETVISNQLKRYSSEWPSQNNFWSAT